MATAIRRRDDRRIGGSRLRLPLDFVGVAHRPPEPLDELRGEVV
jgi:hypothetical protein